MAGEANDGPAPAPGGPSYLWSNVVLTGLCLSFPLYLLLTVKPDAFGHATEDARRYILVQLALSIAGFVATVKMVNVSKDFCLRKNQTGKDLCKKGTPAGEIPIPESQGLAPGVIYLVMIIFRQVLYQSSSEDLANYDSSMLSICFMLFLGFIDDVLVRPRTPSRWTGRGRGGTLFVS
jgi:hypothetical protein